MTLHPEKVQPFAEVKSTISTQLTQQKQEKYFSEWVTGFQSKWTSRSHCASGYLIEQCANYKGSGHPSTASDACYEAESESAADRMPGAGDPEHPGRARLGDASPNQKANAWSSARTRNDKRQSRRQSRNRSVRKSGRGSCAGAAGGAEPSSPETEAAVKAAEEAAAKAAAEAGSKGGE